MIKVENLEKSYGRIKALAGVSVSTIPGRVTGILGPNGCGKTTLIKSILGLIVPDRGQLTVAGENVLAGWNYRSKIGYMPQNAEFPGNLSIGELLDMLEDIRGEKAVRRNELISLFGLSSSLNRSFSVLSGGTKQKVALVTAFMFDPEILVLDEPTVGLDPMAVNRLKNLISLAAKNGKVVLLVTHMVAEIEQLVEDMIFLLDGQVRLAGSLESIKAEAKAKDLDEAIVRLIEHGENRE